MKKARESLPYKQVLPGYVSHILDIFDVNKKSERRPDGNEVRISQLWWTIQDSKKAKCFSGDVTPCLFVPFFL
jgi:hypothetical protein